MRLRAELFESMVQQEVAWFDKKSNNSGSLCARLSGDASSVQGVSTCAFSELPHVKEYSMNFSFMYVAIVPFLQKFGSLARKVLWLPVISWPPFNSL
jgi:ABC-type multidrug transport system fused ATPase/permease subunit